MGTTFADITLEVQDMYNTYQEYTQLQDLTFLELWSWNFIYKNKYKFINGYMCIIFTNHKNEVRCSKPIGTYDKQTFIDTIKVLQAYFQEQGLPLIFEYISEEEVGYFKECFKQPVISYNRDYSDYVYSNQDFCSLEGRAYRHRRSDYNYFIRHYEHKYESLTKDNIHYTLEIMDEWCEQRNCKECHFGCERRALQRLVEAYDIIPYRGGLVKIDNQYKAFLITQEDDRHMVFHYFQKSAIRLKGLNIYLYLKVMEEEHPEGMWINFSEDMGIEGLREYKKTLAPYRLLHKYEIRLEEKI